MVVLTYVIDGLYIDKIKGRYFIDNADRDEVTKEKLKKMITNSKTCFICNDYREIYLQWKN